MAEKLPRTPYSNGNENRNQFENGTFHTIFEKCLFAMDAEECGEFNFGK